MLAVLISVRFWRLFSTDCCPLGACWLSVVQSRRCPLLGGSKCTISIGRVIEGMEFVVHLSESPLLEVSLYVFAYICVRVCVQCVYVYVYMCVCVCTMMCLITR